MENSWKLRSQSRASSRRSSAAGGNDVDCAGSWRPAFLRELGWDEDIELIFVSDFD